MNSPACVTAVRGTGCLFSLQKSSFCRLFAFRRGKDKVKPLLNDFITFRTANEKKVFEMFVSKLQEHSSDGKSSFKLDPTKPQVLEEALQPHYVTWPRLTSQHVSLRDFQGEDGEPLPEGVECHGR